MSQPWFGIELSTGEHMALVRGEAAKRQWLLAAHRLDQLLLSQGWTTIARRYRVRVFKVKPRVY